MCYIRITERGLRVRLDDHGKTMSDFRVDVSPLAEHLIVVVGRNSSFDTTKILETDRNWHKLSVKEALRIGAEEAVLNLDGGIGMCRHGIEILDSLIQP